MSIQKKEEIRCSCGEVFEADLWSAVNAVDDPDLKDALQCGEINVVSCPACGEMFYAEHFLLYHDSLNELIAFVYPAGHAAQATYWLAKMNEEFERSLAAMPAEERPGYRPVILFGLDSLADLIRQEEETSDEVLILEYVAGELGLDLIRLHPSKARPLQLPKVLPSAGNGSPPSRDGIVAGLRKLVAYNENLIHYKALLDRVLADDRWALPDDIRKA